MNLGPVTAATASSGTDLGQVTGQAAKISSDFNTFLRMLTVQMQNQDPLKPIDSADYAVQLATFSSVEQQVRTNQLLTDMQTLFAGSGMAEMAGWIGKEARSPAPVRFDGTPVVLSPNPVAGSTGAVLVVRDMQGQLVAREQIPVSAAPYSWLGADATGTPLPAGMYQLSLESQSGEEVVATTAMEHYARVVEVRGGPDGAILVLSSGAEVAATEVTALRQAE